MYIDDFLIASSCLEEHQIHLDTVFTSPYQFGIITNVDKIVFSPDKSSPLQLRLGHYTTDIQYGDITAETDDYEF